MRASLQSTRRHSFQGRHQLESKTSNPQHPYQRPSEERKKEITALLSLVGLEHIDDPTLVGFFLFIKDKEASNDPIVEEWRTAGERFLR